MTPDLLVCTPLRVEARALRHLGRNRVWRTGYGMRRSARSVADIAGSGFGALAVAGLAGGLASGLRSGDVVVGTGIAGQGSGRYRSHRPELLAAGLRELGLRVWLGPVLTSEHLVLGAERAAMARDGALVVDMESEVLVTAASDRPSAIVRVVLDTRRQPLLGPGSPARLSGALRRLRVTGLPLLRWAEAVAGPGSPDTVRSR